MEPTSKLALRVGVLVATGMVMAFAITTLLGQERLWFRPKVTYRAAFPDVAGLKQGAIVRLGGRDVGLVSSVEFGDDPNRPLIVTFRIRADRIKWVRADSRVAITTQGLLGDKLLDISVGSAHAPRVPSGGVLIGEPPADPARVVTTVSEAATHARNLLARLDRASRGLDEAKTLGDLRAAAGAARLILERIVEGPGDLHSFVFDKNLADAVSDMVHQATRAASEAERVLGVIRIETPAADVLVNASRAAAEVAEAASALDAVSLSQASKDLALIVRDVRLGRGSLGGFLMDPTLYEETKRVLVRVRRNRILTALARLAISRSSEEGLMDGSPKGITIHPRPAPKSSRPAWRRTRSHF
ncbi:MAG: MCE family protein [Deltaproteobacteria bacterium]|nr:MCE family protein [Deltaproteobacteria bacterium]